MSSGLEEDRIIFKDLTLILIKSKLLLFIDEWSFNPSTIPLINW